jgi:hypothetical protein
MQRWDDIWQSAHDRAFMVAGAQKADLLADLREAVGGYFERGDTIQDFRKNFDRIVAERGWTGWTGEGSKAGRAWRTRVIYTTNVASSYAAGRWQQLNDPELLAERPYWRYVHNDSVLHPRPHHKAWGDARLTLPHDHAFWKTHFPPNGWGCRCRVTAVRGPGAEAATEPPNRWNTTDPKTGAPPGIDKGWAYAPGANVDTSLRQLVQDKLIRYPPAIGKALSRDVNRYITARVDVPGFAREALRGEDTGDLWLGFVENPAIGGAASTNLDHYLVLVPSDAVRHVEFSHGLDAGNQRPPMPDDYTRLPDLVARPDRVTRSLERGPNREERLVIVKRWGTETIESVWEIRPGRRNRALTMVSFWVKTR